MSEKQVRQRATLLAKLRKMECEDSIFAAKLEVSHSNGDKSVEY
jgi:hypothetical protein